MSPCSNAYFPKDILQTTIPQDVNRLYLKTGFCGQVLGYLCVKWNYINFFTIGLLSGFSMLMSTVNIQGVT